LGIDGSVDSCVTDPPYELGFMGKGWDSSGVAFDPKTWAAVFRVLKPGAFLCAFGGTRTYHRIACAIEDAGFEIRDCLSWLYGTGFPKSLNVGDGRGTALKPAWEPIILARKPLIGTVAANVSEHGTGALNIDACRIGLGLDKTPAPTRRGNSTPWFTTAAAQRLGGDDTVGRWPANVLLDEEAARLLDEQSGTLTSGTKSPHHARNAPRLGKNAYGSDPGTPVPREWTGDSGGASRFFYCAKASASEREAGCDALPAKSAGELTDREDGSDGLNSPRAGAGRTSTGRKNHHPTVKPIALMEWLVRLVTPPGGTVLDPFLGSGTTGIAALRQGFRFVGVELGEEYIELMRTRIEEDAPLFRRSKAKAVAP
jgi:site-specific DNA-methyltransferase (adenine-specific)